MKFSLLLLTMLAISSAARAQTFAVDFARASSEPPLVKTKFGVYQTPLTTLPRLLDSVALLREAGVRDFRYEIGWGKPESLAFQQIGGTPANLTYDFSMIDALSTRLRDAKIRLLLGMAYNPTPLQTRAEWARWKDLPSNLESWREINRAYAAHLKTLGARANYEVWNEPDMPEPNGKMFFSGDAGDYARLYSASVSGVKSGDADALTGGPSAAYDLDYLKPLLKGPLDFASIHGYDNYAGQIAGMRGVLKNRRDVPIWLTEYASFSDLPANGPQSRHAGAMRFFRDAKGLLNLTDVTRVYWAQWLDAGESPGMGFVTFDGHRKAIYNALKIYNQMPTDRVFVGAIEADGLDAMASASARRASCVIWNASDKPRTATVNLRGLPFANGALQTFRIDAEHASYVDNAASETLAPTQSQPFVGARQIVWRGDVPAQSVVYLQADDAAAPLKSRVVAPKIGDWVRNYHRFDDRDSASYADFDAPTVTARLGLARGKSAQIGVEIDNAARQIEVRLTRAGAGAGAGAGASSRRASRRAGSCALRLDFQARDGRYNHSVLLCAPSRPPATDWARASALPWGKPGGAERIIVQSALDNGRAFALNLARLAPPDWNGKRVIYSFILRDDSTEDKSDTPSDAPIEARALWTLAGR